MWVPVAARFHLQTLQQVVRAHKRRASTLMTRAKTWCIEMEQRELEYYNSGQDVKMRVDNNLKLFASYLSTMDCEQRTTWVSSAPAACRDYRSRLPTHSPNSFFFIPICSLSNKCSLLF